MTEKSLCRYLRTNSSKDEMSPCCTLPTRIESASIKPPLEVRAVCPAVFEISVFSTSVNSQLPIGVTCKRKNTLKVISIIQFGQFTFHVLHHFQKVRYGAEIRKGGQNFLSCNKLSAHTLDAGSKYIALENHSFDLPNTRFL